MWIAILLFTDMFIQKCNFIYLFACQFLLNACFCSANVTNAESPFKIEQKDAEDVLAKSPQPGTPQPVEPIGMYKGIL